WRRRAGKALAITAPARVLDVATGTGDVALALARAREDTEVIGLDPSRHMLARARRKAADAGVDERVQFALGDACALPYPDASFDGVTIAFGIRNVPDRPRALREMSRVTRPGGRVAVLELSEPRWGPLAALARFHIHELVPRIGAALSGAAA